MRADEFEAIAAYVHMSPVKHGLADCPHAWPWSSFHRWVSNGRLRADWQCICDGKRGEPLPGEAIPGCEGEP